ncbi:hypothetical protein ACEPAI_9378 [Sanghuangporus weigelae]
METPARNKEKDGRPRLSAEEKRQLLANLDLEVHHRAREFQETLAQVLENFKNHHEGQVLRVPKLVRGITMGEFADKYNGDINACLRGLQRERQGGEPTLDSASRKRKWKDTEDPLVSGNSESPRAPKTGSSPLKLLLNKSRMMVDIARVASPVKMDAAKLLKARLNKTPKSIRTTRNLYPHLGPNSPSKPSSSRPMSRFMSPTKASSSRNVSASSTSRVPSSNFNPVLPKAPAYPRLPRKDESVMSVNGSPLAFPLPRERERDAIPDTIGERDEVTDRHHPFKFNRQQSIVIRKASAFSTGSNENHIPRSQSPSRAAHSSSGSSTSMSSVPSTTDGSVLGPAHPSAFMRVPTKDGLVLEFDPFSTSPAELDALEGITNSAKKQAREDMTRLVQTALERWKI